MNPPITPMMGDVVYFNKPNGLQRAAFVTLVKPDGRVNVTVFESDGETFAAHNIEYDDKCKAGTWCLPPSRVK